MRLLDEIKDKLLCGDDEKVADLTRQAIEKGLPPKEILDGALIPGMGTAGEQFKAHEMFLPEVLMAARAMHAGMDKLKPLLDREGAPHVGRVVLGTVQGDLHDIGKNLIAIMLRGAGFEVIDLGTDVSPESFVEAIMQHQAAVVGMSALLTTTMPVMKQVVDLIDQQRLSGKVKTVVGGAPVTQAFASEIGADAYGFDAAHAADCVKSLIRR